MKTRQKKTTTKKLLKRVITPQDKSYHVTREALKRLRESPLHQLKFSKEELENAYQETNAGNQYVPVSGKSKDVKDATNETGSTKSSAGGGTF